MSPRASRVLGSGQAACCILASLVSLRALPILAQQKGAVSGVVTRVQTGRPIAGAEIFLPGTSLRATTAADGTYVLPNVPSGPYDLEVSFRGFGPFTVPVVVSADTTVTVNVRLDIEILNLGTIVVHVASRAPDRLLDAPGAVDVIRKETLRSVSPTHQAPRALIGVPGIDVVQSDINDFNVNARGFNSSLSRSMMVLQDGRDLSIPFLGSQEWAALTIPTEDLTGIEVLRGPSSALYGANAFTGVINIATPAARDAVGTRVSLAGGSLGSARGDFSHAGITRNARWGYKVNAGYARSDSWSVSRTHFDGTDFEEEYTAAGSPRVNAPAPGYELIPLNGQSKDPATGAALGTTSALVNIFGSARVDYYTSGSNMLTVDGGVARVENGLFVTAIGRVQVLEATRPWARVAWGSDKFDVSASYSGRISNQPQVLLSNGAPIDERSAILQMDGKYHSTFLAGRGRVVVGATLRDARVNTRGTLIAVEDDNRSDLYYSGYGQVEYQVTSKARVVAAARYDDSDLFEPQVSPKAAVVYSPTGDHTFRVTASRSFLTPSQIEYFLHIQPGVQDFSQLEAGLRASPLGPALAGVPQGALFTESAAVPVIAKGNPGLRPETLTSLELGYRGELHPRIFFSADGYYGKRDDFVTALLPAQLVNGAFGSWTAPSVVPEAARAPLENAVRDALAGTVGEFGLTRMDSDSTAIVLSYGNAGRVNEWGLELGTTLSVSDEISLNGSYAFYDFEITEGMEGHLLSPNTPTHRGTAGLLYTGRQGLDLGVTARFVSSFTWASGVFEGRVPTSETFDVTAGLAVRPNMRVFMLATNVFDQARYHIYGGSVNGRRVLAGVTLTF